MIARCLERADIDNIYPIFYMPDLPRWGRDRCVLVGDAAHAMTPATGQGQLLVHLPVMCRANRFTVCSNLP